MYSSLSDCLGIIIKDADSNEGGFRAEVYGGSQDGKRIGGIYYSEGRIYEEWSIPEIPCQTRQIDEENIEKINSAMRKTLMQRLKDVPLFESRNNLLTQINI